MKKIFMGCAVLIVIVIVLLNQHREEHGSSGAISEKDHTSWIVAPEPEKTHEAVMFGEERGASPRMSLSQLPFPLFSNDEMMVASVVPADIDGLIDAVNNKRLILPEDAVFVSYDALTGDITYGVGEERITLSWKDGYRNVY